MARSVSVIYNQLLAAKAANTYLSGLTSNSNVAVWSMILYIVAICINLQEQVQDIFKIELEDIVTTAPPGSAPWWQNQILLFQYDAVNPQILNLINFAPAYPVVDATKRIISQASVITDINRTVNIYAATGTPSGALSASQKSALQSYSSVIDPAGVQINIISLDADRLYVDAQIFYDGQYSAVIQQNVIDAIDAFLLAIPFTGTLKVSSLEEAILAVAGVTDVILNNVTGRPNALAYPGGTQLVLAQALLVRSYQPAAGYIVSEDTGGATLADSLVFTVG